MAQSPDIVAQAQMIDLPSGRFRYLSWGAERTELPSALLLHGITSSALSWVRVGSALANHYRVYALDMRGHGESIKPAAGAYSLRETADDALALLNALNLERPVLMGHSWGGATAMVLASGAWSQQPLPSFSHVILEDPAHQIGQGDSAGQVAFYTKDIGRPADELRPEITASSPGWTEADIEGKIDALQQVTKEAVISIFAQGGEAGDILPLLSHIAAPTLLIRADPALGSLLDDATWNRQNTCCRHTVELSRYQALRIIFIAAPSMRSCKRSTSFWLKNNFICFACCEHYVSIICIRGCVDCRFSLTRSV